MNLREFVKDATGQKIDGYGDIVREERYFCAVLFHCMLQDPDGMQKFLEKCGVEAEHRVVKGVFIEYAMVRDLWNQLDRIQDVAERNKKKREFIAQALLNGIQEPSDRAPVESIIQVEEVRAFNSLFVASKARSKDFIQSPSSWGITTIAKSGNAQLTKAACKLKWGYNAKPDIVIELEDDGVLYIEAKVESKEGRYATSSSDKKALESVLNAADVAEFRGSSGQKMVQQYIMKNILGFNPVYEVFLSLSNQSKSNSSLLWGEALECFRTLDHRAHQTAWSQLVEKRQ